MILSLFAVLSIVNAILPPPIPENGGHFFYVDMDKGGRIYQFNDTRHLMKYVDVLVDNVDNERSLSLSLDTMGKDTYIFSGHCSNCSTPNNYTI